MRSFAIVREIIDDGEIMVLPLITGACQTCESGCLKQGKPFAVLNKRKIDVKIGMTVKIGYPAPILAAEGILSFIIPILCSIAGLFFAPRIAQDVLGLQIGSRTEEIRALGAVAALILSAATLFAISRSSLHLMKPEIMQAV